MGGREASVISASRVGEKERKRHMMASAFEICREVDICLKKYAPTSPRFLFVPDLVTTIIDHENATSLFSKENQKGLLQRVEAHNSYNLPSLNQLK